MKTSQEGTPVREEARHIECFSFALNLAGISGYVTLNLLGLHGCSIWRAGFLCIIRNKSLIFKSGSPYVLFFTLQKCSVMAFPAPLCLAETM